MDPPEELPGSNLVDDEIAELRARVRRRDLEGLRRYVQSIVRQQSKTLEAILLDGALQFLPVRSLHRLLAVSREWNRRISASFFAHTQTVSHRSLSGLFCCDPSADPPTFYLPFDPASAHGIPDPLLSFLPGDGTQIRASSNGLLYCTGHNRGRTHLVCNPATGKFARLPLPAASVHQGVALDFDPSFLNFSGDYRLICTYRVKDPYGEVGPRKFEVFTSTDGSWQTSPHEIKFPPTELLSWHGGVAVGGKAYWRTTRGGILCFDPEGAGRSEFLAVPEEASGGWAEWVMGPAEGRLCCAVYLSDKREIGVHLLMGGGRWAKVRTIVVAVAARVLAVDGGVVVVEMEESAVVGFGVATGEARLLLRDAAVLAAGRGEFVPYVSNFAPVKRFEDASSISD